MISLSELHRYPIVDDFLPDTERLAFAQGRKLNDTLQRAIRRGRKAGHSFGGIAEDLAISISSAHKYGAGVESMVTADIINAQAGDHVTLYRDPELDLSPDQRYEQDPLFRATCDTVLQWIIRGKQVYVYGKHFVGKTSTTKVVVDSLRKSALNLGFAATGFEFVSSENVKLSLACALVSKVLADQQRSVPISVLNNWLKKMDDPFAFALGEFERDEQPLKVVVIDSFRLQPDYTDRGDIQKVVEATIPQVMRAGAVMLANGRQPLEEVFPGVASLFIQCELKK